MRRVFAVLGMLLLTACTGSDTDQISTSTTTRDEVVTTTTVTPATTEATTPTTTEPVDESDDGSESIGVTDRVTIVVTDPEDG